MSGLLFCLHVDLVICVFVAGIYQATGLWLWLLLRVQQRAKGMKQMRRGERRGLGQGEVMSFVCSGCARVWAIWGVWIWVQGLRFGIQNLRFRV